MKIKNQYFFLTIPAATLTLLQPNTSEGQVLRRLEQKVIQKVDRKVDQTIDKGLDKLEKTVSGDNKPDKKTDGQPGQPHPVATEPIQETASSVSAEPAQPAGTANTELFKRYEKFDFIPGEHIIAFDDYSQDPIGQPPMKWNFEGTAEVTSLISTEQKWVALAGEYNIFYPDFIKVLPENFTLEFDAAVNADYSGYGIAMYFLNREPETYRSSNPFLKNDYLHPKGYLQLELRPISSNNGSTGDFSYNFRYEGMEAHTRNDNVPAFSRDINRKVRISICRQNQRLILYVDHTKVWDLPRAFASGLNYNTFMLETKSNKPFYIGGLRLAEGRPDMRAQFIKDGTFSTSGIHFDLNSANVKPESFGILKEIATVLQSSHDAKIAIIGHTDSDGDEDYNQKLSLARAISVKKMLEEQFGINPENFQVEGKGSSAPVADNNTSEGKAGNRRVEFKKII